METKDEDAGMVGVTAMAAKAATVGDATGVVAWLTARNCVFLS